MNAVLNRMIVKCIVLIIVAYYPSCILASEVTTQIDGIDYRIDTGLKCATVESCNKIPSSGYLIIPESITYYGAIYPVTSIKRIIPSFTEDKNLKRISIPSTVTTIGGWAFNGCINLTEFEFASMEALCKLKLGETSVNPFRYQHKLYIGNDEITSLDNFENIKTINPFVFSECTSIKSANIGNSVEWIEYEAFRNCTSLEQLSIGESVICAAYDAFRDNISLKKVIIKDSSSTITFGELAFKNAPIEEFYMGRNMIYSFGVNGDNDWSAPFKDMESLKSVQIGPNVTEIGHSCFRGCVNLTDIEFNNVIEVIKSNAFDKCKSLKSLKLPNSILSIEEGAFGYNESLTFVKFPKSLEYLDDTAFNGCAQIAVAYLYNQTPPSSIYPFPDSPGAIIYVPNGSLHSYTSNWGKNYDIREMGALSVKLNSESLILNLGDTLSLIPEIKYDGDVRIVSESWSSSNPNVAIVEDGTVITKDVGVTSIEYIVEDEFGIYTSAECLVTVEPTMVESISIQGNFTSLKKGRQLKLIAVVSPTNASDSSCAWSSSNDNVATVDANGVVTALSVGNVNITATANDSSNVTTSISLTVIPPTKGDSNDDDRVTISDAVNTANYAMGYEVENFYPEAADVNEDDRVTVADASATVAIVLEQPEESTIFHIRSLAMAEASDIDELIINDFALSAGETVTIPVYLADSRDYVAMQGDIIVPQGMKIVDVNAGMRAENSHKVATRHFDNGNVRFTLFDLNNSAFMDNDAPVIEIIATAETDVTGDLMVANILGSDSNAREYVLASAGGVNLGASGVDGVSDSAIAIATLNGSIYVYNAEGEDIAIIASDGSVLSHFTAVSSEVQKAVVPGVYVVTVGNTVKKVMVK